MGSTPFHDLADYLALPRVVDLAVSADGSRVLAAVNSINDEKNEYLTAIWELDAEGRGPARRITHGEKGESAPAFTSAGEILFIAARPSDDDHDDQMPAGLWRLPAGSGEAELLAELPGGVTAFQAASAGETVAVVGPVLSIAASLEEDRRLRDLREDGGITAILHTGYPVRYWDKDLGPEENHVFRLGVDGELTDATVEPGIALRDAEFSVSPDGRFAIAAWRVSGPNASVRVVLVRIDLSTGHRAVIADDPAADLEHPVISPDGAGVAFTRETFAAPDRAPRITLCHLSFATGHSTELAAEWECWPTSVCWSDDGTELLVTADQGGRCPIFRVSLEGKIIQLTHDDFSYTKVYAAPGGVTYALRSSYCAPPHPVRIDSTGTVTELPCIELPTLPGELDEIVATSVDGVKVRSWLVLPQTDEPAPLLLWVHGGPLNSWNVWSWRWNPWILAAEGYAVLLPDPALSTGYGQAFIQRGWGSWGGAPFQDLMSAVDAACADPRIDSRHTAVMGGSFGGYMANWIAGQTDRFRAIVTHASIWALDQFASTTDNAYYWQREITPAMVEANSPHRQVGRINTPMLVIHGDGDYRVPIGEALRLWHDLLTKSQVPAAEDGTSPHRFLYFPDEGHWVLSPQHTVLWYQVVTGFLHQHVLGRTVELPETLG
jgi:dipeptidyl aminopeptidase/acylaminoacyl peptidase